MSDNATVRSLKSRFSFQMRRIHMLYTRASTLIYANRFGLTNTECRMIAEMLPNMAGRRPLSELIADASIDNAVATRTVDSLVAKGLVVRSIHPDDARVREVAFTDQGRAVGQAILEIIEARDRRLMSRLSAEQRQVLQRSMDLLIQEAEAMLADEKRQAQRPRRRTAAGAGKRASLPPSA